MLDRPLRNDRPVPIALLGHPPWAVGTFSTYWLTLEFPGGISVRTAGRLGVVLLARLHLLVVLPRGAEDVASCTTVNATMAISASAPSAPLRIGQGYETIHSVRGARSAQAARPTRVDPGLDTFAQNGQSVTFSCTITGHPPNSTYHTVSQQDPLDWFQFLFT